MIEGRENIKVVLLAYLMRVQRDGGVISIRTDDRKYTMNRLYEVRAEHGGFDNITITIPDKEGEIWLINRTSLS